MDRCIEIFLAHMIKKHSLIESVYENHEHQKELLSQREIDTEKMDFLLEQMDGMTEQMEALDAQFQTIYVEVASYLATNKGKTIPELNLIREKNKAIEELMVRIQNIATENRKILENYFRNQKSGIKQGRTGSRVAFGYYQNMSGAGMNQTSTWESRQ